MKYFIKFEDETFDEAKGNSSTFYDSPQEALEDVSGFIGEESPFEIYNLDGTLHSRYVWTGGTPAKTFIPKGLL